MTDVRGHSRRGNDFFPTYVSWTAMKSRCFSPSSKSYSYYGARGITVCERWMSYESFFEDMGPRPEGKTLDRIDVNGNYEPTNCRWATDREQKHNLRWSRNVTAFGKTQTAVEWAEETGLTADCIWGRIKVGVPPEIALTAPAIRGMRPRTLIKRGVQPRDAARKHAEAMTQCDELSKANGVVFGHACVLTTAYVTHDFYSSEIGRLRDALNKIGYECAISDAHSDRMADIARNALKEG